MQHCSGVVAATADTTDMDEGIVKEGMVDEETIEEVCYGENGFLDGSSSTQETKNSVGLVVVSKSSRSCNFAQEVEKDTIDDWNKMKGIVYSCDAYYSNYSCYSKMEMSLEPYLHFKAAKDFSGK